MSAKRTIATDTRRTPRWKIDAEKQAILAYLQQHGPVRSKSGLAIRELAKKLHVTDKVVAARIVELEAEGKVHRDKGQGAKRTFALAALVAPDRTPAPVQQELPDEVGDEEPAVDAAAVAMALLEQAASAIAERDELRTAVTHWQEMHAGAELREQGALLRAAVAEEEVARLTADLDAATAPTSPSVQVTQKTASVLDRFIPSRA